MRTIVKVNLRWDETNPGWLVRATSDRAASNANGHGFDPFPAIWTAVNNICRDLDCHPGNVMLDIDVDGEELEVVIERQRRQG